MSFKLRHKLDNTRCLGKVGEDLVCVSQPKGSQSRSQEGSCFFINGYRDITCSEYSLSSWLHGSFHDQELVLYPWNKPGDFYIVNAKEDQVVNTPEGVSCFRYKFEDHLLALYAETENKFWKIIDVCQSKVVCQHEMTDELASCHHGVDELALFTNKLKFSNKPVSDTITALSMRNGERVWQTTVPKGYEIDPRREVLEAGNILVFSGKVFVDYPIVFFGKKMKPPPGGDMMPTLFALDKATGEFIWGGSLNAIPYWSDFRLSDCIDRETNKLHLLSSPGFSILDLRTGKYEKIDFFEKKEALELLSQSYSCPFQDLFFIYSRRPRKWALYCPKKREIVESGEGDWDELNGPPVVCGNQIVFNTFKELANYEYMDVTYVFVHEV